MRWLLLAVAGYLFAADPVIAEFSLPTTVVRNDTVVGAIIRPVNPVAGGPLVAYFPYPKMSGWATSGGVKSLVAAGWPVVGLLFEKQEPENVDLYDPKTCAYYPESGAGAAWNVAIDKALAGEQRPLFINGESGGSSMGALFAAAYPDRSVVVAIAGGRIFPERISAATTWLVITSRHDQTEVSNRQFVARLRSSGATVLYATTSPEWWRRPNANSMFEHCQGDDSRALQQAFLADMADLVRSTGRAPAQADWPEISTSVLAHEDTLPSGPQLRLPGSRTKAIWEKIQRHVRHEVVGGQEWTVREPGANRTPTGVVIATVAPDSWLDQDEWQYDLEYLADQGLLVLEQRSGGPGSEQTIATLPAVAATPRYAGLPAVAVHVGPSLQTLASVPGSGQPKVKGRMLLDCWPSVRAEASSFIRARMSAGEQVVFVRSIERETLADQAATKRFLAALPKMTLVEEQVVGEDARTIHLGRLRLVCDMLMHLKIIAKADGLGSRPDSGAVPREETKPKKPKAKKGQ